MIACFLSAVVAGCNIFGFLHPATPDLSTGTVDEHIAQGRKLLNAADYAGAAKEFQYAIDKGTASDPQDNVTDAYYYHAVAYSRDRDVDALGVMLKMITSMGSAEKTSLLEGFEPDEIDNIYYTSDVAREDLWAVFKGTDFRQIEIRPENVYFDLTMCSVLKAVTSISRASSGLGLAFEGGSVVFTSTAAYAGLSVEEKAALKANIEDSMESIDEISEIFGDDNEMGTIVGDLDSFFDDLE